MAAVSGKRCFSPSHLDSPFSAPCHLGKRGRFTPCAASMAPAAGSLQPFDALDALRLIFPEADPRDLEARFAASGENIHATVEACRAQQAKEALASRLARAAKAEEEGAVGECAAVLVEQMAAATDAKNRACFILEQIKSPIAERAKSEAAAELREENAALKQQGQHQAAETARLREETAALMERAAAAERDNGVLKHGVLVLQRRSEETERAAAAMTKKAAELEMSHYALAVRLRDAEACRFQTHRGPDVF